MLCSPKTKKELLEEIQLLKDRLSACGGNMPRLAGGACAPIASDREDFFSILNRFPTMVYLQAPDYSIRFANDVFKETYGEPGKRPCYEVMWGRDEPCEVCPTFKVFETKETEIWNSEHDDTGLAYQVHDYYINDTDGSPLVLEVSIDISDLKKAQEEREEVVRELARSQRIEAIGRLAGGIAHDFNNVITVIKALSGRASTKLEMDDSAREYMKTIHEASESATKLIEQLMAYARSTPTKLTPTVISAPIERVTSMVKSFIDETVSLEATVEEEIWPVNADRSKIEQLIMNLVLNAKDSIGENGEIKIQAKNVTLPERPEMKNPGARGGKFVSIEVTDNGAGISESIAEHIFDPFYTTKLSSGTGLGLSVVYGIVKDHDGWIDMESTEGQGARFTVYLPAIEQLCTQAFAEETTDTYRSEKERVLIIEDKSLLCRTLVLLLERHGYTVFTASSGKEATEVFGREKADFDLIISDMMLPDTSGLKLAQDFHKLAPATPIIISSGYIDDSAKLDKIKELGFHFLEKPFGSDELITTANKLITDARGAIDDDTG